MRRRLVFVALLSVAALFVTAAPAHAVKVNIPDDGRSHHHPRGKNFSYLAVRFEGSPGATVEIEATGGTILSEGILRGRIPDSGKMVAVWKIASATEYRVTVAVKKGAQEDEDNSRYTVPYPRPRWGNFRFPKKAGLHNGWPTR